MTSAARSVRLIVASGMITVFLAVLALVSGCTNGASSGPAVGTSDSYRVGERQLTFTEPAHLGPAKQHLGNGDDFATSVTVSHDGTVFVTGTSKGAGTGFDYATIAYRG